MRCYYCSQALLTHCVLLHFIIEKHAWVKNNITYLQYSKLTNVFLYKIIRKTECNNMKMY